MNPKHKRNLIALAEITAAVCPENFSIGHVDANCGTTGCCLGWGSCHPHFQDQGLVYHGDQWGFSHISWRGRTISRGGAWLDHVAPDDVMSELFGIYRPHSITDALLHGDKRPDDYDFSSPIRAAWSLLRYVYEQTGEVWTIPGVPDPSQPLPHETQ